MPRLLALALALLLVPAARAADPLQERKLFGGGMLYHVGFAPMSATFPEGHGLLHGFGGRLHFNLGPWLRAGAGGSRSTFPAERDALEGSGFELGRGYLYTEAALRGARWRLGLGGHFGGGRATALQLVGGGGDTLFLADYRSHPTVLAGGLATLEWLATDTISLVLVAEGTWGSAIVEDHWLGPVVYTGLFFNK